MTIKEVQIYMRRLEAVVRSLLSLSVLYRLIYPNYIESNFWCLLSDCADTNYIQISLNDARFTDVLVTKYRFSYIRNDHILSISMVKMLHEVP